jgi:hypothetical protein
LKVIVHWPLASVFARAFVHVPVGAVWAAPFESVGSTSACSPAAGTKVPEPVSFGSVTVDVCGLPTAFVAFAAIVIFAGAQFLVAFGLSPSSPPPFPPRPKPAASSYAETSDRALSILCPRWLI